MHSIHATMPAQQMYMQQQPVHYAANTPSFNPYPQQQFQMRQQQFPPTAHHHYAAQPQQMMPMGTPAAASTGMPPTLMADPNPLLGTTLHMPYLTSSATGVLQQQQQQHYRPATIKEVDMKNLEKTSPSSSARLSPKPFTKSEQAEQKYEQIINNRAAEDLAAQTAGSADNNSHKDDKPQDSDEMTESDTEIEEGDEDEDGIPRRYHRDFLLSLQFLEQCKQRPPNLMDGEYIRKVLIL